MIRIFNIVFLVFSLFILFYLILPAPKFPDPLPNSIKSDEPGDMEDPMRIAFYTDLSRDEVINFYKGQFVNSSKGIALEMFRLNYPPEEAQTLIRDQTQSTFLEELTHPARESLYVNGYQPSVEKNPLVVNGKVWKQKVTIKYVQSGVYSRLIIGTVGLILLYAIIREWKRLIW